MHDDEDDIPLLEDILRPGDTPPAAPRSTDTPTEPAAHQDHRPDDPALSDEEIEAIAHRVVERHAARIEEAVARAIRKALEIKANQSDSPDTRE